MSNAQSTWMERMARVLFGVVVLLLSVHCTAAAQDTGVAMRELLSSSDFRIRVNAALVLGRSGDTSAREPLERALADAHPAVRIAAATALGYLGDPRAIEALERRLPAEPSPGAAAQIHASLDRLRRAAAPDADVAEPATARVLPPGVRYVVRLGVVRNTAGVRGDDLRRVLRSSTRARARALKDAAVIDGEPALLRQAAERRLPVVTLDATVAQLVESRVGTSLQVQARVEFTLRRDQTLRGTLSGGATTFGSGPSITDQARKQLEDDAVDGAVQSALRGADEGLLVAAR
jgi:hypothetical protein